MGVRRIFGKYTYALYFQWGGEDAYVVKERYERVRDLHKKYGLPHTRKDVLFTALRLHEHVMSEEVGNNRPFFQLVDGDYIPVKFFMRDLE
jgi:hypothetical protein